MILLCLSGIDDLKYRLVTFEKGFSIMLTMCAGLPNFRKKMKGVIISLLFLLTSSVPAYSALTLQELRQMASQSPQNALLQIDSLQKTAEFSAYQLEYLRACAYFRLSMFGKALSSAKKAHNSVEIKSDTILYRQTYMLLAESAVFSYSLNDATYYIQKGKKYALSVSDEILLANMLLSEGDLYRRLGLNKLAYETVFQAIKLLNKKESLLDAYHLSHAYGFLMRYYISDGKYSEAWQVGKKRVEILRYLKRPLRYDNQCGYLYSKMAYLAHLMGNEAEAKKYYEQFLQTQFSKTFVGQLEINDYLLSTGNYEQVIQNARAYVREMDQRDTLNLSYVRLLQQACSAYEVLGDYKSAYVLAKRRLSIQRSMRLNNERNYLLENADLFNTMQARNKLQETEGRLQFQGIFLWILSVLSVLLLLCIVWIIWKNWEVRRKNRKMVRLILDIERQKQQKEQELMALTALVSKENAAAQENEPPAASDSASLIRKTSPSAPHLSNEELFALFDQKVRRDKLFLNYQLGRDDYARIMGIDKNRFATVLKEQAGNNLSAYLNNLRLEHSIELFRLHPEYSINEIATQSALPNISTFYRLFKEKYGMSLSVFRQQIYK